MKTESSEVIAQVNMDALRRNPYPGRFIVMGIDETGENAVQIYGLMGRSENSQNRVLAMGKAGLVFTEAADPNKVKDPSLIIYNAMKENDGNFIVSNGSQTELVSTILPSLPTHLACWKYEPDSSSTPRIAGLFSRIKTGQTPTGVSIRFGFGILRKSPWGDSCDRHYYNYEQIAPGFGFFISTYLGDGNPLPAFQGTPWLMPLHGGVQNIASSYWNAMNEENRVALAIKFIPVKVGASSIIDVFNRFQKA